MPPKVLTESRIAQTDFGKFVSLTFGNIALDEWQLHLCNRLEKLANQTGQRLLIHAPPQHGKSVIVSQRLPAWLMGCNPATRIKLACYNQTHAEGFSRVVKRVMESDEYKAIFHRVPLAEQGTVSAWSTARRRNQKDGQPSFGALGLLTGFVGQGADTLIIDDPYSSPQDAMSEATRNGVQMFWAEAAKVRLRPESNVVVMFHRYHEDDLAGYLIKEEGLREEGGKWELLRYAAQCDSESDPLGREIGQYLSPRYSPEWYREQELNSVVWNGQFQGVPSSRYGDYFNVAKLQIVDSVPDTVARACRAWDIAATSGAGDYTAGVRIAVSEGVYYVTDSARGQWDTADRNQRIRAIAESDGIETRVRFPQDPGAAGVDMAKSLCSLLAGYHVSAERVSGAKEVRADPFASQVNAGNVRLVRGAWNSAYINELRAFPRGKYDDQVDASADAFNAIVARRIGRGA